MPLSEETKFAAMYVDYGDSCDGKARLLGVYSTMDAAVKAVKADMSTWIVAAVEDGNIPEESINADFDEMTASLPGEDGGCEWSIEEFLVEDEDPKDPA